MDSSQPHHHHLTEQEWDAVNAAPDFQALARAKRAFVTPAVVFFLAFYFAFFAALAWWPGAMMRPVWGNLTVGVALALAQFATAWILLALYLPLARKFDDAAARIVQHVREERG
ncbi:MAG: DUF485 domain-containing protein [Vulcanimicrobiaceae bacterium]